MLAEIALRAARIQLASSVLSVWGRTPATLAMTAATLHQVCGGRYVLGLGASTGALAEGFHDTPFEHPVGKLRDTVTKVRALLSGQPVQLHHAPAARPLRLGQPPAPDVPIWVAALEKAANTMNLSAADTPAAQSDTDDCPGPHGRQASHLGGSPRRCASRLRSIRTRSRSRTRRPMAPRRRRRCADRRSSPV